MEWLRSQGRCSPGWQFFTDIVLVGDEQAPSMTRLLNKFIAANRRERAALAESMLARGSQLGTLNGHQEGNPVAIVEVAGGSADPAA